MFITASILLPLKGHAANLYLDNQLPDGGCTGSTYSIASRNCSGADGTGFDDLQEAINAAGNDDTIYVRGGTFNITSDAVASNISGLTIQAYGSETPIFDGNDYTGTPGQYATILRFSQCDGVTVDGLTLQEWSRALVLGGCDNATVTNNNCNSTWTNNVVFQGCDNLLFENNTVTRACYKREDAYGDIVGGGNVTVTNSDNVIIRYNTISHSHWEGLDIDRDSDDGIVEYNKIFGNFEAQLYIINSRRFHIRYNLIYGTIDGIRTDVSTGYYPAVWISNESYSLAFSGTSGLGYHRVYGNLIANTTSNILVTTQQYDSDGDGDNDTYITQGPNYFYNNTNVAPRTWGVRVTPQVQNMQYFRNNIFYLADGAGSVAQSSSDVAADYNVWSVVEGSVPSGFRGSNDTYDTTPPLTKLNGWSTLTLASGPDVQDFSLTTDTLDGVAEIVEMYKMLLPSDEADITNISASDLIDNTLVRYSGDDGPDPGAMPYESGSPYDPAQETDWPLPDFPFSGTLNGIKIN